MTRNEWLNSKSKYIDHFKNKEFFPNLTEEDLDEVLKKESVGNDSIFLKEENRERFEMLVSKAEYIRELIEEPMTITSGFRSMRKHAEIYKKIAKRKKINFDYKKVPMGSKHLSLQAFDFTTKNLDKVKFFLKKCYDTRDWATNRPKDFISGLYQSCFDEMYFEDFDHTPTWIHCQIVPPRSKDRFFKP